MTKMARRKTQHLQLGPVARADSQVATAGLGWRHSISQPRYWVALKSQLLWQRQNSLPFGTQCW